MDPPQRSSSETTRPSLRPLLPAAAPRTDIPQTQPKRTRVSLACAACRSRKTKCDGGRPQCGECVSRSSECLYTETETTQTKRKHADLEELFELIKTLPDKEALELFGRIRAGVELRDLVEQVQHGSMLVQLASVATSVVESEESRKSSLSSQAGKEPMRRPSVE